MSDSEHHLKTSSQIWNLWADRDIQESLFNCMSKQHGPLTNGWVCIITLRKLVPSKLYNWTTVQSSTWTFQVDDNISVELAPWFLTFAKGLTRSDVSELWEVNKILSKYGHSPVTISSLVPTNLWIRVPTKKVNNILNTHLKWSIAQEYSFLHWFLQKTSCSSRFLCFSRIQKFKSWI